MCDVLRIGDLDSGVAESLLRRYGIELAVVEDDADIPATFWGEPEAGIVGCRVYVRSDTPVHSMLHESCHVVCMTAPRRASLERDAGGDDLEEAAVCYLQVVLADAMSGVGRGRLMRDMDRWGYSFRLGDTASWFEQDAGDAKAWLQAHGLLSRSGRPVFRLRQ